MFNVLGKPCYADEKNKAAVKAKLSATVAEYWGAHAIEHNEGDADEEAAGLLKVLETTGGQGALSVCLDECSIALSYRDKGGTTIQLTPKAKPVL